jgi:hypothetical protein
MSRCPRCGKALDYAVPYQTSFEAELSREPPDPRIAPCPGCELPLLLGYYGVHALPDCIRPGELKEVRPYELDEAIDRLVDEREPLPEPIHITVKHSHAIHRSTTRWIGGWAEEESRVEEIDVSRNRRIMEHRWRPPRYLTHGKKGKKIGQFGAPLGPMRPLECPGGPHLMTCLLHVDPVSVWWCEQCSYCHDRESDEGALYTDCSNPEQPRIISRLQAARDAYGERKAAPAAAAVLAAPPPLECQTFHKLNGSPLWIQGNAWPKCIVCGGLPEFWGQVGADEKLGYEFGDSGVVYVFWCPRCRVTATGEQCF